jgi:CubicO group peptidase (beta-lactamase class C family)
MLKKISLLAAVILLSAGAYGINYLRDIEAIAAGYVSQTLCTNVLMLGRDQAEVEAKDLSAKQNEIATSTVKDGRVETTTRIGPVSNTTSSVYRPGLGCSILAGRKLEDVLAVSMDEHTESQPASRTWPAVNADVPGVDREKLDSVTYGAFTENTDDIYKAKNTRAVLVHYKGNLIAERYAEGFDGDTPLRGMSMTKSATATVIGILVGQGRLDIHAPAPIDGWSELDDGRSRVTTHHLLTMTAGFDYQEKNGESAPRGLLVNMLYAVPDSPGFAAQTPLRGEPGNSWAYQTVHSVLLQQVARNVIADDQQYYRFAQRYLFDKLGMGNSFFQADAAGNFIGGASMYASARDWMKLGLLYLNDGVHQDERILPEGWVEYATTASEPSLQTRAYGAQIWLNTPAPHQLFPGMPEDAYAFQGHFGQYVIVVPSLELVVVRMGMTFNGEQGFDKQALLRGVVAALPAG